METDHFRFVLDLIETRESTAELKALEGRIRNDLLAARDRGEPWSEWHVNELRAACKVRAAVLKRVEENNERSRRV